MITKEQQAAIAAKVESMTLPRGMGTEESACSIAAINLALSGRLTDQIPDCMSEVVGKWVIRLQDAMPDDTRNSQAWKSLLPLAAGTGRDHEREREAIIMDWMWGTVLPYAQPIADADGYGKEWRAMCEERTATASWAAAWAADRAWAAYRAVRAAAWAAAEAAEAADRAAADWADWAAEAVIVVANVVKKSGNPKKAWAHFNPCGLLQKLIEVGKPCRG